MDQFLKGQKETPASFFPAVLFKGGSLGYYPGKCIHWHKGHWIAPRASRLASQGFVAPEPVQRRAVLSAGLLGTLGPSGRSWRCFLLLLSGPHAFALVFSYIFFLKKKCVSNPLPVGFLLEPSEDTPKNDTASLSLFELAEFVVGFMLNFESVIRCYLLYLYSLEVLTVFTYVGCFSQCARFTFMSF